VIVFKEIIANLKKALAEGDSYWSLEAYISANNPQSTEDVERLEYEFERRKQMNFFERYF